MLNRFHKPGFRVLATPYSEAREQTNEQVPMAPLDGLLSLYFGGDLDAAFAFGGQVAGRIDDGEAGRGDHRARPSPSSTTPCSTLAERVLVNERLPALDGLRVLEASEGVAGAYAGKLLRDQGADVVKLERSDGGDPLRRWSAATPDTPIDGDRRAVRVPRRRQGERDRHRSTRADERMAWADVDPRRRRDRRARRAACAGPTPASCAIEPFGADGPLAGAPASEFTLQAWCGLMSGCGTAAHATAADGDRCTGSGPPARWRRWPRSPACGRRARTGTGAVIEVSALEVMAVVPQQLPAAVPAVHRLGVVHVAQRRLAAGRAAARTAGSACACSRRSSGPTSRR